MNTLSDNLNVELAFSSLPTDIGKTRFTGHDERNWTKKPSVSAQIEDVSNHKNVFDCS
jgi:hypothetical protein